MSEREKNPIESCDRLQIGGVTCIAWAHPLKFPFNVGDNTEQVVDILKAQGTPTAVTIDTLAVWMMSTFNRMRSRSFDPVAQGFIGTNNVMVLADFFSSRGDSLHDIRNRNVNFGLGALTLGVSAYMLRRFGARKENVSSRSSGDDGKFTRREFLAGLGAATFALGTMYVSFRVGVGGNIKAAENLNQKCDPGVLFDFKNQTFVDPEMADLNMRTGIVIAKQMAMQEKGFYKHARIVPEKDLSVWGTDHLGEAKLPDVKAIVDDPEPHAHKLIHKEYEHLRQSGETHEEALRQAGVLLVDMAAALPVQIIERDGNPYYVPLIEGDESIFYDERILGHDGTSMNYWQACDFAEVHIANNIL